MGHRFFCFICVKIMSHLTRKTLALLCASLLLLGVYAIRHLLLTFGETLLAKSVPSCAEIRQDEITFLSGNLQLRGTLYSPACQLQKKPGIVLCHGATGFGRRLELYSVMGPRLAQRGYVVLSINFRGFGDSEDPHRLETFADLDFVHDISSAMSVLSELDRVDPSQLFIIGHSFGAGVGLAAGIRDFRSKGVVSISPPRLARERFFAPNAPTPDFPQVRISSRMELPQLIPQNLINPHFKDYMAEAILDYPKHPPILFVDGENEPRDELDFLQKVYEKMAPPKSYITIPKADHYFGTTFEQSYTENLTYDEGPMNALLDNIASWLKAHKNKKPESLPGAKEVM